MSFFQRLSRLPSKPRPYEVGNWLKGRKYAEKFLPVVDDIRRYRDNWVGWWSASQPKWRSTESWPFPKGDKGSGSWEDFPARGSNGIFLVIMTMCWWAKALESTDDFIQFEEAVDDIHWVINQFADAHSPPSASDEPQPPPSASRPPPSASWPHTFSRSDGKRAVKPSQRVRDAL